MITILCCGKKYQTTKEKNSRNFIEEKTIAKMEVELTFL